MDFNALTREMGTEETPQLVKHLLALGMEDRRLRFGHVLSDDGIRKYVAEIDMSRDVVFVVTDAELDIIGAAHLARRADHAELGISVHSDRKGRGIGTALLERCTARVRNWGVRVLFMNCLVENATMMHLARKQGLKIAVSGTDAEAFVRLPRGDLSSLAAETVAEHLGLFDYALKSSWLALQGRHPALAMSPKPRPDTGASG
ncbi:MAG: GNAT family N-acetyltransferase [Xanthobacteraceae bacterium]|nr:GNAT family N-acetyltransferase [Xanthobacteraceae bacterium]